MIATATHPTISRGLVLRGLVWLAVASSTIVFSEPAPVDALMLAVIAALAILGMGRVGGFTLLGLAGWLIIVAGGLVAAPLSPSIANAATHLTVTLFLSLGSFAMAVFIAIEPLRHSRLVGSAYVVAALIAAVAGIVGYFGLLPGAEEIFTQHGRARGPFKDPNVLGAALAPALAILFWDVLRGSRRDLWRALALAAPIALGLLLSFSRGAWFSAGISLALVGFLSAGSIARAWQLRRLAMVAVVVPLASAAILGAALEVEQVCVLFEERASLDQSYDQGPNGRFGGQEKARRLIVENPLGIGAHAFRSEHHHEEAHNVYLSMFLNSGWLGGFAYIAVVLATLAAGFKASLSRAELAAPAIIATAAFAGLVAEGYVIDTDHWRHFFLVMGCLWGLAGERARI